MGKIPVILEIKLPVKKTENEIGVRKKSRNQTRDRSPIPDFFLIDRPGNHCTCKRMGDTVHKLMLTQKSPCRQIGNVLMMG
jgi:hypothetical protein